MAGVDNLTPFDSERASAAGKVGGANKKGSKHLSTYIKEFLNDDNFEANILDSKVGLRQYKGTPAQAIVEVAVQKALAGDARWGKWLGDFGFGAKLELANNPDNPIGVVANDEQLAQLIQARTRRSDI